MAGEPSVNQRSGPPRPSGGMRSSSGIRLYSRKTERSASIHTNSVAKNAIRKTARFSGLPGSEKNRRRKATSRTLKAMTVRASTTRTTLKRKRVKMIRPRS